MQFRGKGYFSQQVLPHIASWVSWHALTKSAISGKSCSPLHQLPPVHGHRTFAMCSSAPGFRSRYCHRWEQPNSIWVSAGFVRLCHAISATSIASVLPTTRIFKRTGFVAICTDSRFAWKWSRATGS